TRVHKIASSMRWSLYRFTVSLWGKGGIAGAGRRERGCWLLRLRRKEAPTISIAISGPRWTGIFRFFSRFFHFFSEVGPFRIPLNRTLIHRFIYNYPAEMPSRTLSCCRSSSDEEEKTERGAGPVGPVGPAGESAGADAVVRGEPMIWGPAASSL